MYVWFLNVFVFCLLSHTIFIHSDQRIYPVQQAPVSAQASYVPNAQDLYLLKAIEAGSLMKVKQAIAAGADVNQINAESKSPLLLAAEKNMFDIVLELLEWGAKVEDTEFPQLLLDAVDPGMGFGSSINLTLAIKCLALLVANGVDFSGIKINRATGGLSPQKKVKTNDDIITFTVDSCKKAFNGSYAVQTELQHNLLELIRQLASHGYPIIDKIWNVGGEMPSLYEHKELVDLCIKHGINLNKNVEYRFNQAGAPSANNKTFASMPPLFIAIKGSPDSSAYNNNSYKNAVKILLEAGANINQLADPDGKGMRTPLDMAFELEKTHEIDFLIQNGAKTARQLR